MSNSPCVFDSLVIVVGFMFVFFEGPQVSGAAKQGICVQWLLSGTLSRSRSCRGRRSYAGTSRYLTVYHTVDHLWPPRGDICFSYSSVQVSKIDVVSYSREQVVLSNGSKGPYERNRSNQGPLRLKNELSGGVEEGYYPPFKGRYPPYGHFICLIAARHDFDSMIN